MALKKIYIYPSPYIKIGGDNPYLKNLKNSLKGLFKIINDNSKRIHGEIGVLRNINNADLFYFNWIENRPNKKFGFFRFILIILILNIIKLNPKKSILWTHHNLSSHNGNNWMVDYLFSWLSKNSNYVIAHSIQTFTEMKLYNRKKPILYFPHPVFTSVKNQNSSKKDKEYDILIWGKMSSYKGILEFIKYANNDNTLRKYKIALAGKFVDYHYYNSVVSQANENVIIFNKHFSNSEIEQLHYKSRYVLFSYNNKSVLNSGVLADSIGYRHTGIIGPNKGAFKDMSEKKIIFTFKKYEDILNIISSGEFKDFNLIDHFSKKHTWCIFGKYLENNLNETD